MRRTFFRPAIACVTILASCSVQARCDQKAEHQPIGVVLTYQLVREDLPKDDEFDIQTLVDTVNRRIADYGVAKVVGRDRFEVGLYGKPEGEALEQIKWDRIGVRSTLEFRILAHIGWKEDQETVDLAKKLPAQQKDVKKDNTKVAEWVAYPAKEFGPPENETDGMVKRSADGVSEALVLMDPWNVTGKDIRFVVSKVTDETGGPAIRFSLDQQGAQRFRQLTSRNLPNPTTPKNYRRMGIILNKKLISAPFLRTTISDYVMISGGSMTEKEVDHVVEVLNMSTLPVPFQIVNEKRPSEEAAKP
jgi:preprotein translocase subunit SecD